MIRRARFVCVVILGCSTPPQPMPEPIVSPFAQQAAGATWRLFHTSDEHGWMEGERKNGVQFGGIAMLRRHLAQVDFVADRDLLVSGGDMWTGPALSTLLQGKPMVELFNLSGYIASALGNHEFDFGRKVLAEHIASSRFAYLAANVVDANGKRPAGVLGHLLLERGGRRIGLIGLANRATPLVTMPRYVEGLRFAGYGDAALRAAQALSGAGAQDLIILVHDDARTLMPHIEALKPYGLRAVLGGHVHRSDQRTVNGVLLCTPAHRLRELCQIDRRDDGSVVAKLVALRSAKAPADPEVEQVIAAAKQEAERRAGQVLTRLKGPLTRGPVTAQNALGQLVGLAWLAGVPSAKVAITNRGGLRQNLAAGPLRVTDLVGVMPFSNQLVVVTLTGAQLKEVLGASSSMVTGARLNGDEVLVRGAPVGPTDRVAVVINDFMHSGGDGYRFPAYDAPAVLTGIPWRVPVRAYLKGFEVLAPEQIQAEWEAMQPLK